MLLFCWTDKKYLVYLTNIITLPIIYDIKDFSFYFLKQKFLVKKKCFYNWWALYGICYKILTFVKTRVLKIHLLSIFFNNKTKKILNIKITFTDFSENFVKERIYVKENELLKNLLHLIIRSPTEKMSCTIVHLWIKDLSVGSWEEGISCYMKTKNNALSTLKWILHFKHN